MFIRRGVWLGEIEMRNPVGTEHNWTFGLAGLFKGSDKVAIWTFKSPKWVSAIAVSEAQPTTYNPPELIAYRDLTEKGSSDIPKLLGYKTDKQDRSGLVPGGFIIWLVWEIVPGLSASGIRIIHFSLPMGKLNVDAHEGFLSPGSGITA
ncbi:hypothetical protein N7472_006440 [Penicillium cf. griseofulvum]|uniref:Uncharacterized protein n=1 Tax=Penicillium cf. griseofulvum TaxID=2972120 RepID=A0A9W9M9R1_9EURO|nr:hypothetical protein N7472_006440 [Penicillium cf. griseofulvum]